MQKNIIMDKGIIIIIIMKMKNGKKITMGIIIITIITIILSHLQ